MLKITAGCERCFRKGIEICDGPTFYCQIISNSFERKLLFVMNQTIE